MPTETNNSQSNVAHNNNWQSNSAVIYIDHTFDIIPQIVRGSSSPTESQV